MTSLVLPAGPTRKVVLATAALWLGTWAGLETKRIFPLLLAAAGGLVALALRSPPTALAMAAGLAAGLGSGLWTVGREAAVGSAQLAAGPVVVEGRLVADPSRERYGAWALIVDPTAVRRGDSWEDWEGPPLRLRVEEPGELEAGWQVRSAGELADRPGRLAAISYGGVLTGARLLAVAPPTDPLFRAGNGLRRRILEQVDPYSGPAAALLAGFVVGHTEALAPADLRALRRSGLAHFVAVSGSNVALFLGVWWILLGPLGMGRRRAWLGLAGLAVFVVMTRWEPSVLRAASMAAVVLTGRALGIPVEPWAALGAAVAGVLVLDGRMAESAGFQLSVFATAGVIAGSRLTFGLPASIGRVLGATVSAQAAVLPITLGLFGAVPLGAPIANLLAVPLVTLATLAGGVGAMAGLGPLVEAARLAASGVLVIGRVFSPWPQLGPGGVALVAVLVWWGRHPTRRPLVVAGSAAVLVWVLAGPAGRVETPAVVFLDVGQGDSILLLSGQGHAVLVDGGPRPETVLDALDRYRVARLDLVVLSHVHEDHAAGLEAVVETRPVGAFWQAVEGHTSPAWERLAAAMARQDVPVAVPEVGTRVRLGDLVLTVLGPLRRYDSPNDQSVVLLAEAGEATVLLPGDIEKIAQADLGPLPADILKVPHQGAATSDLEWLVGSVRQMAVISVGPNDYGHPAPEVIAALEEVVPVIRTDRQGDVAVPLRAPLAPAPAAGLG